MSAPLIKDFGGEREAFEEAKSAIARAKGGAA